MRKSPDLSRRSLLTGKPAPRHHISSAVVMVHPVHREDVRHQLERMTGVEVHAGDGSRLVVTIEGPSTGMLGETLTRMSLIGGVISANMVFEHVEERKDVGP